MHVFLSVSSGRATNHHAMVAVGYVWFGCVIFLCDCGVVGIRVWRKRGLFLFVRLLARVWYTVASPWAANRHLGTQFGAVGLEWDVLWHRAFLASGGLAVFFRTR